MSSPAHHEATKAAMKEAGCRNITFPWCVIHDGRWNRARDVCGVIDDAARVAYDLGYFDGSEASNADHFDSYRDGYEAGRREALNDAAEILRNTADAIVNAPDRAVGDITYADGWYNAADCIRALASTPTNEERES